MTKPTAEQRIHTRTLITTWLQDIDSHMDHTLMAQRFWNLTTKDQVNNPITDCITWRRPPKAGGYPMFSIRSVLVYGHRIAVRIGLGDIPPRAIPAGMVVDHDTRNGCMGMGCVNPHHLAVIMQRDIFT